jgi:hypothetical protein
MICNESKGSGAAVAVIVTVDVATTTEPSGLIHWAVIVLIPGLTPTTSPLFDALHIADGEPLSQTVAIAVSLELHLMYPVVVFAVVAFVSFCVRPVVPLVPIAISWPCPDDADNDSEFGMMLSAVIGSEFPLSTEKLAVPVATVPSVFA